MRLIDADTLRNTFDAMHAMPGCSHFDHLVLLGIKKYIDDSPTIDAAPVVHGHYGFVGLGVRAVEIMFGTCSECRERIGWYSHNTYCPNCGAKMDGGVPK